MLANWYNLKLVRKVLTVRFNIFSKMCEENKKFWDESQISAINAWHSSGKSFSQIDEEYNFAVGTLFTIVNAIPDYRGTRSSISKWLRRMTGALIPGSGCRTTKAISSLATRHKRQKERNDKENLSHYQAHGYRADHTGSNTQVKRRHQKDRETGG